MAFEARQQRHYNASVYVDASNKMIKTRQSGRFFFLEGNESVYIIVPKSINTIDDILWGKRWHQNEYQLMDTLYWCPTTIYYIFHMRRWNLEIYNFAGIQGISTKSTGSWYSVLYYEPVNLDEAPCISIWKQPKVYSALIYA